MRDYGQEIAARIAALPQVKDAGLDAAAVAEILEVPQDAAMGDFAFPCFRLAKAMRKAPQAIAGELADALSPDSCGVEVVGAYVNFRLERGAFAAEVLAAVREEGAAYGHSGLGGGRRVIVEYSSPNIAKPFHIGHIRSTVIGAAIARILAALGYEVERINHLGDYGTQFGKLIVAYRRFGSKDEVEAAPIATLLKYYVEFHKQAEQDPSLEEEARAAFAALERGAEAERELWAWFREESLKEFTAVYDMLGITFDSYAGESFYSDKMRRITDELAAKGLLTESEGAQIVDLDDCGLGKALIKKSDGSTLYITRDIAAAVYRKEHYDFHKNIYVVASQQDLHFRQWIKIVELMGYDWAHDCVHVPFGLVRLADGAMSTRTGNVVFLLDVLNQAVEKTRAIIVEKGVLTDDAAEDGPAVDEAAAEIGIGAVVFQELHNNRIKDYVFDWDKALNFDGETGPYVQYGYARAASVLRKAEGMGLSCNNGDTAALTGDAAFALLKKIYELPQAVREAGEKYEPSLLTRHVVDVAQAFSAFYHEERILSDDPTERGRTEAKLALTAAAKQAIGNGLALLGVAAPERM
ncbi:MAG: arginine--tRNA ligase [Clostridiales Family XIII bacterium]|jgi:arginyl-tRNA synthetase|nr:arginine--tRNA ligase [Clostridiales Family XIII bacterium]